MPSRKRRSSSSSGSELERRSSRRRHRSKESRKSRRHSTESKRKRSKERRTSSHKREKKEKHEDTKEDKKDRELAERKKLDNKLISEMESRRKRVQQWKERVSGGATTSEDYTDAFQKSWSLENDGDDTEQTKSVTETVIKEEEDEGPDPLDEYMNEIKDTITKENIKFAVMEKNSVSKTSEIIEQNQDEGAANYDVISDDEDLTEFVKKNYKKNLEAPDHNKIYYAPFRKDFYVEVPEIAKLTADEVFAMRKEMEGIRVRGKKCPKPVRKWTQMGLNSKVLDLLKKFKYTKPTPIQCQVIPAIMSGRDCIGIAKTGSGKTLAFLLPMFRQLLDQPPLDYGEGPLAVVVSPTRELALQTFRECSKFAKVLSLTVCPIYGGNTIADQISTLKRGSEIVICTPGRMIDMLSANNGRVVNFRKVTYLVLDEADRMFDMGFEPQVMRIIEQIRPDRQTVLFSATFPRLMESLARKVLTKPIEVQVGGRSLVCNDVEQHLLLIEEDYKFLKLLEVLGYHCNGSTLIFVEKQESADILLKDLLKKSYPCLVLHGGMDQEDRDSTLSDFKQHVVDILIATSVAARGLDVKSLNLVVNYDCPNHYEDYVHRCGRTGRAGNKGLAITFITQNDMNDAVDIIRNLQGQHVNIPANLKDAYDEQIEKALAQGKTSMKKFGYKGRGYKFTEEEELKVNEMKRMMKWTLGMQNSDDEAEEEEKMLNKIEDDINKAFDTSMPKQQAENKAPLVDERKLSAAQIIASKLNERISSSTNDTRQTFQDATSSILRGEELGELKMTGAGLAKQMVDRINSKLNYVGSDRIIPEPEPQGEYFFEEIDINDFPQQARWKITSKDTIDTVSEIADVIMNVKGGYVPPGKTPFQAGTDRRLYLTLEGTSQMKLHAAKSEIKRILREEILRVDAGFTSQQLGRYKVL